MESLNDLIWMDEDEDIIPYGDGLIVDTCLMSCGKPTITICDPAVIDNYGCGLPTVLEPKCIQQSSL